MAREIQAWTERRRHPRAAHDALAVVHCEDRSLGEFVVENISVGGARLCGDTPIPVGVSIQLHLLSGKLSGVSLQADVVGTLDGSVGVRFSTPPSRIESMIQEVVLTELAEVA